MNVEPLITLVRSKVAHRLPFGVDYDAAVDRAFSSILDSVAQIVQYHLEQAMLGAQSKLQTKAEEYIRALKVNDDLTIGLSEEARYLEDGYNRYEMLPRLATGPKSKISKDGSRYAVIPIGKSKGVNIRDAMSSKASDIISSGALRPDSQRTLQDMAVQMSEVLRAAKNLGAKKADSFAIASTKQENKWTHPGFDGVKQLDQINAQLKIELEETTTRLIEQAARGLAYE